MLGRRPCVAPLDEELRIDQILVRGACKSLQQPWLELATKGGCLFARPGETLSKRKSDERIHRPPAYQFAKPEADPRQAGGGLPHLETGHLQRCCVGVPRLGDRRANRDSQSELEIVGDEVLPAAQFRHGRRRGAVALQPPASNLVPAGDQCRFGGVAPHVAEAAASTDEFANPPKKLESVF